MTERAKVLVEYRPAGCLDDTDYMRMPANLLPEDVIVRCQAENRFELAGSGLGTAWLTEGELQWLLELWRRRVERLEASEASLMDIICGLRVFDADSIEASRHVQTRNERWYRDRGFPRNLP